MSLYEIQKLTRQNSRLNQQLRTQTGKVQLLQNECEHNRTQLKKAQADRQFLNQQIKELRRREEDHKYVQEETENRYLNVLTKLESELEESKAKYEKLEARIQPLVDHDTVRLKILNEVQGVHFLEVEEQRRKNSSLKDQVLRLRRELQVCKHQLETTRIEHQQEMRRLRNGVQNSSRNDHLNEITYELCLDVENRLRANYEQARKEADYYKDKYFSGEKRYNDRIRTLERELAGYRDQMRA